MVYRKGERPAPQFLDRWSVDHTVTRAMREGDSWFRAWTSQKAMPLQRLETLAGIPRLRLETLSQESTISRAEFDALACAWGVNSDDLVASMDGMVEVVE